MPPDVSVPVVGYSRRWNGGVIVNAEPPPVPGVIVNAAEDREQRGEELVDQRLVGHARHLAGPRHGGAGDEREVPAGSGPSPGAAGSRRRARASAPCGPSVRELRPSPGWSRLAGWPGPAMSNVPQFRHATWISTGPPSACHQDWAFERDGRGGEATWSPLTTPVIGLVTAPCSHRSGVAAVSQTSMPRNRRPGAGRVPGDRVGVALHGSRGGGAELGAERQAARRVAGAVD